MNNNWETMSIIEDDEINKEIIKNILSRFIRQQGSFDSNSLTIKYIMPNYKAGIKEIYTLNNLYAVLTNNRNSFIITKLELRDENVELNISFNYLKDILDELLNEKVRENEMQIMKRNGKEKASEEEFKDYILHCISLQEQDEIEISILTEYDYLDSFKSRSWQLAYLETKKCENKPLCFLRISYKRLRYDNIPVKLFLDTLSARMDAEVDKEVKQISELLKLMPTKKGEYGRKYDENLTISLMTSNKTEPIELKFNSLESLKDELSLSWFNLKDSIYKIEFNETVVNTLLTAQEFTDIVNRIEDESDNSTKTKIKKTDSKDYSSSDKIYNKNAIIDGEKEDDMFDFNSLFGGKIGIIKDLPVRTSFDGSVVVNQNNKWLQPSIKNNKVKLKETMKGMTFKMPVFVIPDNINNLKTNDLIISDEEKILLFHSLSNGIIRALDIEDKTMKDIVPIQNMFMPMLFIRKIVSFNFFNNIMSGQNQADNANPSPFGNMMNNPMQLMMISTFFKDKEDDKSSDNLEGGMQQMFQMMMMQQMMQGNMMQNNFMQSNPPNAESK